MTGLGAMLYREARLRATNATFIFWDVVYPLAYLLVFGVGMSSALGGNFAGMGSAYSDFFLAGVLGMASFGIASNTAWSLFMDRDNGIFYEMLTYPLSRAAYLIGKVLFNGLIARFAVAMRALTRRDIPGHTMRAHAQHSIPRRTVDRPAATASASTAGAAAASAAARSRRFATAGLSRLH